MSKKRGLSADEKRSRMLDLFYEKKDFFLLKELERMAPKEKGIVSQSVKDVLQSLVDDSLVDTDKIGTSVYFWAFPSKASASRKRKLEEAERVTQVAQKRLKVAKEKAAEVRKGREDTEDRKRALDRLIELKAKKEELQREIQKYKDCDPQVLELLNKETKLANEGANRYDIK